MTGYVARLDVSTVTGGPIGVVVLTNGDNASPTAMARRCADARTGAARADAKAPTTSTRRPADAAADAAADAGATWARIAIRGASPSRSCDRATASCSSASAATSRCATSRPGRFLVDLPRGGTETIAFGLPATGPADYLQMNVWALARVTP